MDTISLIIGYNSNIARPKKNNNLNAGIDLACYEDTVIYPYEYKRIKLNAWVKFNDYQLTSKNFYSLVVPRSSCFERYGIILVNGAGIIDYSYCGKEDQLNFLAYKLPKKIDSGIVNDSEKAFIKAGSYIAQLIPMRYMECPVSFSETMEEFSEKSRGGIGSTGGYK